MDKIDKDLDGIIAYENSENSFNTSNIASHKSSSDHDERYYTETEFDAKEISVTEDSHNQLYARLLNPVTFPLLQNTVKLLTVSARPIPKYTR